MAPMEIAKKVGCTPALVYNVKARLAGGPKKPGRPRKNAASANGVGFDSLFDAVKATQADLGRYRTVLERISNMVSDVLA